MSGNINSGSEVVVNGGGRPPPVVFHPPTNETTDNLTGRALASLAEECKRYYYAYYRKSGLWQAVQTALSFIGAAGPIVFGIIVVVVPTWSQLSGFGAIVSGAFSALSSYSPIRGLIKNYDEAGDAFKTLGLSIQYDGLVGVTTNTRADLGQYLDQLKALINKYEDPGGMSTERFRWVHDHVQVYTDSQPVSPSEDAVGDSGVAPSAASVSSSLLASLSLRPPASSSQQSLV